MSLPKAALRNSIAAFNHSLNHRPLFDSALLRHGMTDVPAAILLKPFSPEALLTHVRETLSQDLGISGPDISRRKSLASLRMRLFRTIPQRNYHFFVPISTSRRSIVSSFHFTPFHFISRQLAALQCNH
jgi:hypothetical protein